MNRPEFIRVFAKSTNRKQKEITSFLNDFEKVLLETLKKGETISFHGFCRFGVKHIKPHSGTHPKDFSKITIGGKNRPYVKFGRQFREAVLNCEVHENTKD